MLRLVLSFLLVVHTAKAHNLKGQLPEGNMESLATTIRFVTLNCRTLSSELQQAALSRPLRYLCVPFAALQETHMRDRPVISIENYTIYCGDADENKVGGCAIAVRNDYKNLVEEFSPTSSRCAFLRLRDRRGRKLWIVSAHAPTETAENNSKDALYDELNALMSKIPSQQVVTVGIDANAKMGLEQQSDVLGKWYYAAERTSDSGARLVDICEQTGLITASTFKRNHRRHQLTWQGSTLLTPEEQRKRKMRTLQLQLDYVLARNIPRSDIRKSRAVWDVAFDSPHRGCLLNVLRADGVPGKFVRLLDDMNQRTTAAVRTPAGCTTPFEVVTGVRQVAVAGPFLFNFAIDHIMRRTVDQCPADIVLAPSGCPLTDLEYAHDVVIFAESSTKIQHVVNLVSKLATDYGLRLRPDKCKQMWTSSRL
ncbi:hypothetical protein RB195_011452 [Necator americanus]|uniref:Reverse transcriptase domain-containing protein n=1 Tax=Necator americanus TaxID=51031 RepID=A0ABR1D3K9_NECAM